ncbi:calcium uptake protein, mitochondrial-like [Humulus lupulus]|uniref:calcium uptake protein, mitochondrial-like n=1 Tax=Humulus lupulus TaxID=3486 RepID=UPI002B40C5BC|nr:calcium uptake protein, mitochondrial-like [Humulus lupulus]
MFSRESIRKSLPSIPRVVIATTHRLHSPPLFSQTRCSTSSSSSSLSSHNDGNKTKFFSSDRFLRSVSSGVVILGFSLGLFYYSSPSWDSNLSRSFEYDSKETISDNGEIKEEEEQFQESRPEKNSIFLFKDAYRRRVFFKYEKRIRMQSPPEKVFEYFASVRTPAGEIFMKPTDLMRAVVPVFPPSESDRVREGFLRGERVSGELHCAPSNFFMLFDTNNDGLISFAEYLFFVTLLRIPDSSFSVAFKMFDLDNNGEIDREEFCKLMALMRAQTREGAQYKDGRRLWPKAVSTENGGLLVYFFGKDGKNPLRHEIFDQFLRDLHNEILWLEFSHYDHKSQGTISAKDFALSLVASADINHINKLLNRVDKIETEPRLAGIRVTFEEFKEFANLRKQLQSFSLAIFSYGEVNGALTKNDFQRAASQVCGVSVTNNVVDIIFHVFDANRDGSLSVNEFLRVLQKREGDSSEGGYRGLISCWLNCATCSSAKLRFSNVIS